MSAPLLSSSAGFPHYERPLQAGPTPLSTVQGSKIVRGLKISPLPASEDWLAEKWESHSPSKQPYYKQLADALDHRGLAGNLVSLGQVRLPDGPIDKGHPSVVVGVADNSSEDLVAEVASEVRLFLQHQPPGLEDGLDFNYQYRRSIDSGQHFGRSIGSLGGTTGSTGPLVRVKLPDGAALFGLVKCHHALSSEIPNIITVSTILIGCAFLGSKEAIHASPDHALSRLVVSPSDPDHKRWVNHLETSLDQVKNQQEPVAILAMRCKLEAGETLEPNAQQYWDYYHRRARDKEAMKTQAETFERHLGYILCTSGLGTDQYIDGHHYTQDWGLFVDAPLPWSDDSDGKPYWKIGRTTGQTVGGLCATAIQSIDYDCDEGNITAKGAARMVVSAVTRKRYQKTWSDSGDSGAGVFGPDHRIAGSMNAPLHDRSSANDRRPIIASGSNLGPCRSKVKTSIGSFKSSSQ
ncbi:hypothetical protein CMUS01_03924 [Colletotrichum musicola]|uniref:Uncharacterized protein n=1 Tax=Colletotrichum musicola TaxID=2175873 RepID=A0A8H6NPV8_9PEZI|nr:hypothetical protein CMUS01_03924 [Colletotrichum musicola]